MGPHPEGEVLTVTRDGRVKRIVEPDATSESAKQPAAIVDEESFDFGVMDPLTRGRHVFTVRNDGDEPLRLQKGPTTCKCTLSKLAQNEVLPGGEAFVTLDWNTGRTQFYSHEAAIYTNDPATPVLRFRVHGTVRKLLGTIPEDFSLANLRPDKEHKAEIIVYSLVWNSFKIVAGHSSSDLLSWSIEDFDHETLDDATAAQRIKFTVPAGLPSGAFAERLQFTVRPADGEETTLDVPLTGRVPRRLAVMGSGVQSDGVIDLGQMYVGERLKKRFLLKVRDEDRDLIATHIKCEPEFVSAIILPYEGSTQDAGLSTLEIEVPRDAPPCSYLGVPMGTLHVDFDHPRIQSLDLKVKFAIVEQDRKEG